MPGPGDHPGLGGFKGQIQHGRAFSLRVLVARVLGQSAGRGKGWQLAVDGEILPDGRIPVCTMGGLKARGHPVGATGVYQIAEASQQLRGKAGDCQIPDARLAMAQNIGGSGATIVTHILEKG